MTVTKRHDSLVLPMIYQIDNLVTRRDLDLVGTNPKLAKVSFCWHLLTVGGFLRPLLCVELKSRKIGGYAQFGTPESRQLSFMRKGVKKTSLIHGRS